MCVCVCVCVCQCTYVMSLMSAFLLYTIVLVNIATYVRMSTHIIILYPGVCIILLHTNIRNVHVIIVVDMNVC